MSIPSAAISESPSDGTQPEVLLPQQFTEVWHRGAAATPVQRLALAVLLRAILDLAKYRFARRLRYQKLYADAYAWVTARREDDEGLSFVRICDTFDIDSDAARKELLALGTADEHDPRAAMWEEAA